MNRESKYSVIFAWNQAYVETNELMLKRFTFLLLFLSVIIFVKGQDPFHDLCLTPQELELAQSINKTRIAKGLPEVPLSRSLCYVADVHAKDLYFFHQGGGNCSLHSWSDKGRWSGCCYENPKTDGRCMHNKPSELTDYSGLGFELVYWDNTTSCSENALSVWLQNTSTSAMWFNSKAYEIYDWNAMGVSIFKGYVIVWFGTIHDNSAAISMCLPAGEIAPQPIITSSEASVSDSLKPATIPSKLFYVVVASYGSKADAVKDKTRWEKRFFEPLKLIDSNGKYRLAVGAYENMETAESVMKKIKKEVHDAWILSVDNK